MPLDGQDCLRKCPEIRENIATHVSFSGVGEGSKESLISQGRGHGDG